MNIYSGKEWSVVLKLLKLLDTCAKNCNMKFQVQLANKEFLNELKAMIGPKLNPPLVIQETVLSLIEDWSGMFKHGHEFKTIEHFYNELKTKGIEFPKRTEAKNDDLQSREDFNKIPSSTTAMAPTVSHPQSLKSIVPGSAAAVHLNEEQMAKLKSELDIVDNNILVMNEVLTSTIDSKKSVDQNIAEDINLLKELFTTSSEMQKRITQLIGNISNENIIDELLRINDDLNNVFVRYERFQKGSNFSKPAEIKKSQAVEEKSLIDFGDEDSSGTSGINIDLLNINSKTTTNMKTQLSKTSDEDAFLQDENEIREMENWLKTQELENAKNNSNSKLE